MDKGMNAPVGHARARPASRRKDIQGLRAVAVIVVVAFHAGLPVRGGFVGVDVFFVISGFVISAMLLRELESTGSLDFVAFYSRRARRILPALALVIVATVLASSILLSPLGSQQRTAALGSAASLFGANGALYKSSTTYFDASVSTYPLLHTWSLAVEEQFYLFFPGFLLLAWRFGRRATSKLSARATAAALLAGLAVVSFALSLRTTHSNPKFAFYASPTRAWEFAVGALLAVMVPELGRLHRRLALSLGAVGVAAIALSAGVTTSATPFPGTAALLPVLGAAGVLAGGTAAAGGASSLLSTKPAVWIGDLSYGWYLWHWPAIVFTRALWPSSPVWLLSAVGLLSILPAWLSARLLEDPIRHNANLSGRRILPLVAGCTAIPIFACFGLWLGANFALTTNNASNFQSQARLHADKTRGCDAATPVGQTSVNCIWSVAPSRGSIVLIGDSNAGQYTEPVARAAARLGFNLTVATADGCPFVDLVLSAPLPFNSQSCHGFVSESIAALTELKPNLVIIASSTAEYLNNAVKLHAADGGQFTVDKAAKQRLWEQGLASVLQRLVASGVPTLVVRSMPHIESFDLTLCPALLVYIDTRACGRTVTRQQIADQQRLASAAEGDALQLVPQVDSVDFTNDLCTRGSCSTNRGNDWIYRDAAHLSVGGALGLSDHFVALIQRQTR
jgi:peptidoglycan/LPS O-acetylase OafA/YrhL